MGVEPDSVFRRLGEGTSGVEGETANGEEAAALCMNFIVKRREDMVFGSGVVVPDIVRIERRFRGRSEIQVREWRDYRLAVTKRICSRTSDSCCV